QLLELLLDDLAADGRGILIATHDVEQVARWDEVLCLNRRQVAFGPPEETLTPAVLAETYGAEIVRLEGVPAALLPPHHHCWSRSPAARRRSAATRPSGS